MLLSFVIVLLPFFISRSNSAAVMNSSYDASMSDGLFSAPGEDINKLSTDGLTKGFHSLELAVIKKIINNESNYNLKPC